MGKKRVKSLLDDWWHNRGSSLFWGRILNRMSLAYQVKIVLATLNPSFWLMKLLKKLESKLSKKATELKRVKVCLKSKELSKLSRTHQIKQELLILLCFLHRFFMILNINLFTITFCIRLNYLRWIKCLWKCKLMKQSLYCVKNSLGCRFMIMIFRIFFNSSRCKRMSIVWIRM